VGIESRKKGLVARYSGWLGGTASEGMAMHSSAQLGLSELVELSFMSSFSFVFNMGSLRVLQGGEQFYLQKSKSLRQNRNLIPSFKVKS
jgi:hypothetical protein